MSEPNFVGYEYQSVTVMRNSASMYLDGYENFGWAVEGMSEQVGSGDSVTMKFKRDRKIRNKSELTRLQRQFDGVMKEILSLEGSKHRSAAIAAFTAGIIGTAFMAGSVFSITAQLVIPCILLAIPAFVLWICPYFLYRRMERKKTAAVTPLIDDKYEELYTVCEKANGLLC